MPRHALLAAPVLLQRSVFLSGLKPGIRNIGLHLLERGFRREVNLPHPRLQLLGKVLMLLHHVGKPGF